MKGIGYKQRLTRLKAVTCAGPPAARRVSTLRPPSSGCAAAAPCAAMISSTPSGNRRPSHLLSFIVMFWKLHTSTACPASPATRSCRDRLNALYLDLFWNFLSAYNWIMKVIISSVGIVYIMRYEPHKDTTTRTTRLPRPA